MEGDLSTTVALLSPGWPQPKFCNGIVSYTANLRPALQQLGAPTWVIALQGTAQDDRRVLVAPQQSPSLAARISGRLMPQRRLALQQARRIACAAERLARESGVRVLEMEDTGGWSRSVAQRLSIPVVVRLHGPWFLNGLALGVAQGRAFLERDRAEGRALAEATWISAPSRDVLERCRLHFGLELPRAEVIPNPIRVRPVEAHWTPSAADRDLIAFVGRFDRMKGGDSVIEAFGKVLARNPRARLAFFGPDRGLQSNRGRAYTLRSFAEVELGSRADAIRHVATSIPDQVWSARRAAWITVIASRYENHPYTALEAMSMGCPVVATAVGGLREIFEHRRTALLCRSDDPTALAEAILELQQDPALAEELSHNAVEACRARFDPGVIARRTLNLYQRAQSRIHAEHQ